MAYFVIEDFKSGLDSRRLAEATPAGALITLENAVINRGGEIEKAKDFKLAYTIPPGTFGLAALKESLYVFGSGADPGVPAGLTFQALVHEGGAPPAMSRFVNWDVFASKLFTIAEYTDNSRRAFYDGTIVAGLLPGSGTAFDGLDPGDACRTLKNKMYICNGSNIMFSKLGDASIFDELATGSGLIDITLEVTEEADIVGMQRYQNKLAVASGQNVSMWNVDPDPTKYSVDQVLENLSLVAARTMRAFGDHDDFMLSDTGYRSLRAINASLAAGVDDVGTPIDDIVTDYMDTLSSDTIRQSIAIIEPRTGRYLDALGEKIFAFTYFAKSKISAWSTIVPGINLTDLVRAGKRIYGRAGNKVYLYGGPMNTDYTPNQVTVELPYLDARKLSTWKSWTGIDIICRGAWKVEINDDPNNPNVWKTVANITRTTVAKQKGAMAQYGPVLKFKFTHQGAGAATLSKIVMHYEETKRQD